MRGFNMILIVMLHVFICSYHMIPVSFNWHSFFALFCLPLFFFVSGFLFYKIERQWNFSTMCKMVVDKAKNLFVPTFIFFCLYTFIFNEDFIAEIDTDAKSGYWFTITLYWFITIYSIVITVFRGSRWGKLFLFVLSVPMLW